MPFAWSKKVIVIQPEEEETIQKVELPVFDDKISLIEHKNGKRLVNACEKNDETNEVQGDLQKGGRPQKGDNGSQEKLAQFKD